MYTHPHHIGGGWVPPHMIGLDHSLTQQHGLYPHSSAMDHSSVMNANMYYDMDAINSMHQDVSHLPPITRHDIQSTLLQQAPQTTSLPPVSQALPPGMMMCYTRTPPPLLLHSSSTALTSLIQEFSRVRLI